MSENLEQANSLIHSAMQKMSAALAVCCGKRNPVEAAFILSDSCEDLLRAHFITEELPWPAVPSPENLATILLEHEQSDIADAVKNWKRHDLSSCQAVWDALLR